MAARLEDGLALHRQGKLAEAADVYRAVLAAEPGNADAHHLLGMAVFGRKDYDAALSSIDRAIALNPKDERYHLNRANVLRTMGRNDDALAAYANAGALKPAYVEAWYNRALLLAHLERIDEATVDFNRALTLRPDYPEALYNWGVALSRLKRFEEALASFDKVTRLKADFAPAHFSKGAMLAELNRYTEALASYDRAIALNPADAAAHNNRANMLAELGRGDEAIAAYDRAIALNPGYAEAYNNRGNALVDKKRIVEALASYETALTLAPDFPLLAGIAANTRLHLCDWRAFDADVATVRAGLAAGASVIAPFGALSLPLTAAEQRRCAEIHVRERVRAPAVVPPPVAPGDKIRIGYFSPDLRNHPVASLTAGLYEHHDRAKFEVIAFSYGATSPDDPVRGRLIKGFDRFFDVREKSDSEVLAMARGVGLDVAVDLAGYTLSARPGILAGRPAPVQVSYLGYPGTMGAPFIDYLIADDMVVPPARRGDYSEKLALLPTSFQVNDDRREIAAPVSRAAFGLKETDVVFCSFNNVYKLNPPVFKIWMNILRRVPGSVLWVLGDGDVQMGNLRAFAGAQGIEAGRLVFAGRLGYAQHLARYTHADLVLDTLPFNGGTTTSDALWGGAPVLTCAGETYAGRMAASLLNAVGLPELITDSMTAYEDLAVALGQDPARRAALRARLKRSAPLFDTARTTKSIEAAYTEMVRRHRVGLSPDHITVAG